MFTLYLQDRKNIVVLVKRAVSGGYPLKCVDLAALLNVKAHGVFDIELTLKAGAFFEDVEVRVILDVSYGPSLSRAILLGLTAKYDKEVILHN